MLRNVKDLFGYGVQATDGEFGSVQDVYFDDEAWAMRYFVIETGGWLSSRRVLIAPEAFGEPDASADMLSVRLTQEQVKESPSIDTDKPISRQEEDAYRGYYGWAPYWTPTLMGVMPVVNPVAVAPPPDEARRIGAERREGDPHLRSANQVIGYHIEASDGEIGHVDDLIVETSDWALRYLVIDTKNWLPGKKVLLAPEWVDGIDYFERNVRIGLTKERVKDAPEFDASAPVNRAYETQLYDYYGRPVYWS